MNVVHHLMKACS